MRIPATILVILSMLFLLAIASCGGGTPQTQTPPAATNQPAAQPPPAQPVATPPAVAELIDFSGTDVNEFIAKWDEVGGDDSALKTMLPADPTGAYNPLTEWRVTEIEKNSDYDEYEIQLEAGAYWLQGLGGEGLDDLDFFVYGPDPENAEDPLAADDAVDAFPVLYFELEEDTTITLKADPVTLAEGVDKVKYCWYIYPDTD